MVFRKYKDRKNKIAEQTKEGIGGEHIPKEIEMNDHAFAAENDEDEELYQHHDTELPEPPKDQRQQEGNKDPVEEEGMALPLTMNGDTKGNNDAEVLDAINETHENDKHDDADIVAEINETDVENEEDDYEYEYVEQEAEDSLNRDIVSAINNQIEDGEEIDKEILELVNQTDAFHQ